MTYKKGEARWEEPEGIVVPLARRGQESEARVLAVVGHRAAVLQLVGDLLDLVAEQEPVACIYEALDDGTLRTKNGNVIAACADNQTAALVGAALDRFDRVTAVLSGLWSDEEPLPWTPWKGPYVQ